MNLHTVHSKVNLDFNFKGKIISEPMQLEQYIVIADYQKQNRSEVSVLAGDIVEVIEKNENGIYNFLLLTHTVDQHYGTDTIHKVCAFLLLKKIS